MGHRPPGITLACLVFVAVTLAFGSSVGAQTVVTFEDAGGHTFELRVDAPLPERRNGYAVMMLEGGFANDMDWSVPAPMTIDGRAHADAPRLASELVRRGFIVFRYSTIHRGDVFADDYPYRVRDASLAELLDIAERALLRFRELNMVKPNRVILLGRSLGAWRAVNIAQLDPDISGFVLLGGARLTRTSGIDDDGEEARTLGIELAARIDANKDGRVSRPEFDDWRKQIGGRSPADIARLPAVEVDYDGDTTISPWEISAIIAADRRMRVDFVEFYQDKYRRSWGEDVIVARAKPTLIIYGAEDNSQGMHGPVLAARLRNEGHPDFTYRVIPEVGHTLARERGGRVAPISPAVTDLVARWLDERY